MSMTLNPLFKIFFAISGCYMHFKSKLRIDTRQPVYEILGTECRFQQSVPTPYVQ